MNIKYDEQSFWDKAYLTAYEATMKGIFDDSDAILKSGKTDLVTAPAEFAAHCADQMVMRRRERTDS